MGVRVGAGAGAGVGEGLGGTVRAGMVLGGFGTGRARSCGERCGCGVGACRVGLLCEGADCLLCGQFGVCALSSVLPCVCVRTCVRAAVACSQAFGTLAPLCPSTFTAVDSACLLLTPLTLRFQPFPAPSLCSLRV
eukprot:1454190-Pleurochrysis_carterae.AAC.1